MLSILFFFFNYTASTEIYTLSLHDALPILAAQRLARVQCNSWGHPETSGLPTRSEEHTSELQSLRHLVCRLLLEKKKKTNQSRHTFKSHRRESLNVVRRTSRHRRYTIKMDS